MFSDVSVHPIDSHEVYKEVMEAAIADGHGPYMPTHYVMKNGIVIGAFSTILGIRGVNTFKKK